MEEKLNSKLVDAIVLLFSTKKECIEYISNTLSIGLSSAKRRLNKDVFFSYGEAAILADALNLSLDSLLLSKRIQVDMNLKEISNDPIDLSCSVLTKHLELYEKIDDLNLATLNVACNALPYSSAIEYDTLYKFFIYKSYFQNNNYNELIPFAELELGSSIKSLRKKLAIRMDSVGITTIVFDKHIVFEIVNDILYLKDLMLLNDTDLSLLKDDLMQLIQDVEIICSTRKNKQGNKIDIYISDIALDASYALLETKDAKYVQVRLHSINTMVSEDPLLFDLQEQWMNSIRKYATLISKGGEVEKKIFFDEQKLYVEKITAEI